MLKKQGRLLTSKGASQKWEERHQLLSNCQQGPSHPAGALFSGTARVPHSSPGSTDTNGLATDGRTDSCRKPSSESWDYERWEITRDLLLGQSTPRFIARAPPDTLLPFPEFAPRSTCWCWEHHKWLLNDFWQSPGYKNREVEPREALFSQKKRHSSVVWQTFIRWAFKVRSAQLTLTYDQYLSCNGTVKY